MSAYPIDVLPCVLTHSSMATDRTAVVLKTVKTERHWAGGEVIVKRSGFSCLAVHQSGLGFPRIEKANRQFEIIIT